jgi:hypothetical protein
LLALAYFSPLYFCVIILSWVFKVFWEAAQNSFRRCKSIGDFKSIAYITPSRKNSDCPYLEEVFLFIGIYVRAMWTAALRRLTIFKSPSSIVFLTIPFLPSVADLKRQSVPGVVVVHTYNPSTQEAGGL